MATWKKVIVSGSNISQLVNDANYVASVGGGILSASAEGAAQGQIELNGVDVDINGLGTGDSPTFVTVTADLSGNASTATTLETARNIGGVSFDGSADINLPGVNTAGNQDTSGTAADATALETGRDFSISGDATATAVSFDGTGDVDLVLSLDNNVVDTAELAAGAVTNTEVDASAAIAYTKLDFAGSGIVSGAAQIGVNDSTITLANATNGGISITDGSFTLNQGSDETQTFSLDLNDLSAGNIDVTNDEIAFTDGTNTRKESVADLVAGIAGTGLDAASGQLSVDVSDFMTNGANNRLVTATGTDGQNGEANLTFDGSTLAVTGNVTATGTSTMANLTLSGDLTVNGETTTINTTNLEIEDRFLFLNEGSGSVSPAGEGGIIVEGSVAGEGHALYRDGNSTRWSVAAGIAKDAISAEPDGFLSVVLTGNASSDSAIDGLVANEYEAKGNIFVGDDEGIWIYS